MVVEPIKGFRSLETHHCITGSLRHIYHFYDYPISEDMLLGLGAGVGFIYWHMKGTLPFLGGRANLERPGEEGLEKTVGRRTGVAVTSSRTGSARKAETALLEMLGAEQPVMLVLDMGFLPYFDFGGHEYHFGQHAVVACGYDPDSRQVLIADRDRELHPVSLEDLARARGSKYKPFPPQHAWYRFEFSHAHPPEPGDVLQAINQCAKGMLEPPISNLGIKGIHKAAQRIRCWSEILDERELREACINTAILIDARGGTGGGLFRSMYARFLEEAAEMTGEKELFGTAKGIQTAGDCWEQVAGLFEQAYRAGDPNNVLEDVSLLLPQIAQQEESVWRSLYHLSAV